MSGGTDLYHSLKNCSKSILLKTINLHFVGYGSAYCTLNIEYGATIIITNKNNRVDNLLDRRLKKNIPKKRLEILNNVIVNGVFQNQVKKLLCRYPVSY